MKIALSLAIAIAVIAVFAPIRTVVFADADKGAKIFTESCTTCHSPEKVGEMVQGKKFTREQWTETVSRMISNGADVPKKQIPDVVDYLVRKYGSDKDAPAAGANK